MNIKGQYLKYQEYKELGGTLELTPFNVLEFEARRRIDVITQNRLVGLKEIPTEVKMCMYKVIDAIKDYNDIGRGKSSETVGSYSVSYSDLEKTINDKALEISDIIVNNLYGVVVNNEHILYCGVR
jgi:hypothetical protein